MANRYDRIRKGKDAVILKNGKHFMTLTTHLYKDPWVEAGKVISAMKN